MELTNTISVSQVSSPTPELDDAMEYLFNRTHAYDTSGKI
jgi:hypothetical protein